MKRLFRFLAPLLFIAGLIPAANAAGTIPFSLSQQFDALGKPLSGGRLFFYQAGTVSTPQNAYQDQDLTIPLPNPIELDASGRIPQFFLADGNIKVRLTDKNGVTQIVADNVLVIGPSSGGGGGGGGQVDPTTIIQTGDVKYRYGTGSLSGFVRANGRTIGSASSGASERANADCQALFEYLWGADATLVVSGGRGASAAADWSANKTITLPDFRGRVLAGLDDMGAGPAARLTSAYFGPDPTVLGAGGGAQGWTLTTGQIPSHRHPNTLTDPGHSHTLTRGGATVAGGGGPVNTDIMRNVDSVSVLNNTTGITITNGYEGGGQPHPSIQPTSVVTLYIKL